MRLFVALEIPQETRRALGGLIAQLKPKCPSAKWVRPEAMHVTLKLIGHVDKDRFPAIRAALENIQSDAPLEVHFRGLGFFPNETGPRVFWCGVTVSANAAALAADVDQALAKLGVEHEHRAFTPHLTLARLDREKLFSHGKTSPQLVELVRAARQFAGKDFGSMRTPEFHLFESKLSPTGAEYTSLQTFRFAQAAS